MNSNMKWVANDPLGTRRTFFIFIVFFLFYYRSGINRSLRPNDILEALWKIRALVTALRHDRTGKCPLRNSKEMKKNAARGAFGSKIDEKIKFA